MRTEDGLALFKAICDAKSAGSKIRWTVKEKNFLNDIKLLLDAGHYLTPGQGKMLQYLYRRAYAN
jgi:hypothetical protein